MTCEKASKRLKILMARAKRLGINNEEITDLPAVKKLTTGKVQPITWSTFAAFVIVILGGGIFFIYLCNPCNARRIVQDARSNP